ncbi:hypothetical protein OG625_07995 [Streptomyces sp. NBC_01351]|uniref:hypothetical protein n=1 Tax=Streptomyces sp. NBC_01351 TaxID=2903833 RepID=UPI002E36C12A|nr:hypothetical protein [Streptomyces sp. NBC_01351]
MVKRPAKPQPPAPGVHKVHGIKVHGRELGLPHRTRPRPNRTVPDGAWMDWRDGRIVAKNPDPAALAVLRSVARALGGGARVQGDDGELYD